MWLIWALLTRCVDVAALLATNYGFGVGLDYFKCFFWGAGYPGRAVATPATRPDYDHDNL